MVTANPGRALERVWKRPVGRIVEGGLGDLCIIGAGRTGPYRSLVRATEADVRLVVIGGRVAYGLGSLVAAGGIDDADPIKVGRLRRRVAMRLPAALRPADPALASQADLSWADGLAQLEAVRHDPGGAVRAARARRPRGGEALRFIPDMPGPGGPDSRPRVLDDQELDTLVMPPLDPLVHDKAFFDRLDAEAPAHARVLTGLRAAFG